MKRGMLPTALTAALCTFVSLTVAAQRDTGARILTKDQSVAVPARQIIAVGETYSFEYEATAGRKTAWLEARTTGGKWQVQAHVIHEVILENLL